MAYLPSLPSLSVSRVLVALAVPIALCAGCTSTVGRTARVPHASVPMFSGQPMSTPIEVMGGVSSVADLKKPARGDRDSDVSVEVPGTQLHGEVRFRTSASTFAGVIIEDGLASGSHRVGAASVPVGNKDVFGIGGVFAGSLPMSPELRLGLLAQVMRWSVPYVSYQQSADGTISGISHDSEGVSTFGVGVTPSYHHGRVTLFGTAFVRNHPQSRPALDELLVDTDAVEGGPFNLLLGAGLEVAIAPRLSATALVQHNLTSEPVRYGPSLAFSLTGKLGN